MRPKNHTIYEVKLMLMSQQREAARETMSEACLLLVVVVGDA